MPTARPTRAPAQERMVRIDTREALLCAALCCALGGLFAWAGSSFGSGFMSGASCMAFSIGSFRWGQR